MEINNLKSKIKEIISIFDIFFKKKNLLAIYIIDDSIKFIRTVKKGANYNVVFEHSEDLEDLLIVNSLIDDPLAVSEIINKTTNNLVKKNSKVAFCISASLTMSKIITITNKYSDYELNDMFLNSGMPKLPYKPQEAYCDYLVLDRESSKNTKKPKQKILAVAAPLELIEQYKSLAETCNLSLEVIDIDSHLILSTLNKRILSEEICEQANEGAVMFIQLEKSTFKVFVVSENSIIFSDEVPTSGKCNNSQDILSYIVHLKRLISMFNMTHMKVNISFNYLFGKFANDESIKAAISSSLSIPTNTVSYSNDIDFNGVNNTYEYLVPLALSLRTEV